LDLQLIQRASNDVGAQLACVADDDDVLDHAQELGIPVFRSSRVAEKIPWRRARKKKIFEAHTIHPANYFVELKAGFKSNYPAWWEKQTVRWLAFSLGIAAVMGLLIFLLPGATVKLAMAVDEQSVDLQVWASPVLKTVNLSGGIPASSISTIVEGKGSLKTTGSMILPDQSSTGKVTFTNLTDEAVLIPAGTMVQSISEPIIQFRTLQAVLVDAQPGAQTEVGIQAVQAGSQGNIHAGEIQAVIGSLGTKVSVSNMNAITGGRDVSSPAASQLDLDQLQDKIIQDLKKSALQDFETRQISETRLLPQTLHMTKIQEELVEPAFGLPADQIQMTLRVEFQVWAFREADLDTIAHAALDASIGSGKNPLQESFAVNEIQPPIFEKDQIRWSVKATQLVQSAWDSSKLIKVIAGKTAATAVKNLAEFPGMAGPPQITLSPNWWPVLPLLPARIEVEVR